MRISDWSSDGALPISGEAALRREEADRLLDTLRQQMAEATSAQGTAVRQVLEAQQDGLSERVGASLAVNQAREAAERLAESEAERKSAAVGKRVPVLVDHGWRRIIKNANCTSL